ncbi:hypothetical protein MNV49_007405 [Pseudohyphozyma bogoriensis]|nr:hypothetical protein MNV49_007405 [Pseudohyphozyma bogoriensis]
MAPPNLPLDVQRLILLLALPAPTRYAQMRPRYALLTTFSLVCRDWADIAQPLLWKHLYLPTLAHVRRIADVDPEQTSAWLKQSESLRIGHDAGDGPEETITIKDVEMMEGIGHTVQRLLADAPNLSHVWLQTLHSVPFVSLAHPGIRSLCIFDTILAMPSSPIPPAVLFPSLQSLILTDVAFRATAPDHDAAFGRAHSLALEVGHVFPPLEKLCVTSCYTWMPTPGGGPGWMYPIKAAGLDVAELDTLVLDLEESHGPGVEWSHVWDRMGRLKHLSVTNAKDMYPDIRKIPARLSTLRLGASGRGGKPDARGREEAIEGIADLARRHMEEPIPCLTELERIIVPEPKPSWSFFGGSTREGVAAFEDDKAVECGKVIEEAFKVEVKKGEWDGVRTKSHENFEWRVRDSWDGVVGVEDWEVMREEWEQH